MGKYLLFHRHHVVKLLLWIGMEGGDRLCDCLPGLKQTVNHQNGWLRNTHVSHTENGGQQEKPRYVAS